MHWVVAITFAGAGLRMVWTLAGSGGGATEREGMEVRKVGGSIISCWKAARVSVIEPQCT